MDSDLDWEEIVVPEATIEITLDKGNEREKERTSRLSPQERLIRLEAHKFHTICLLSNASTRNKWINDELLHARLISLVPLPLQNSFAMIHKKFVPDAAKRGRLFEAAMIKLTLWWHETFEIHEGIGMRSRTFDQVQAGALQDEEGEVIKGPKSLMKHALLRAGSRDVSAQLFTALCRALDIPARLVVSLQSVPWQSSIGKPQSKPSRKGKRVQKQAEHSSQEDEEDDMEEVDIPMEPSSSTAGAKRDKGKARVKLPSIRKASASSSPMPGDDAQPPIAGWPPVVWTEVFSRPDTCWIPVDPARGLVNKKKLFEPPRKDPNNRMLYVVAFEEDGYARDVTPRYANEYAAKTSKRRIKAKGGKGKKEWWDKVMDQFTRPYRLNRDDLEDEELEIKQMIEGMPSSMAGFKDHPIYVLERHLKREEVIHPRTELGKFRGEPVFARANVLSLKTAETWMRQGRKIKEGMQPLKMVKQRASTVNKIRAVKMAESQAEDALVLQGMYSHAQTELYRPDPVVDGIVPKNDFGNIDLYVPSMLPRGAAHIPYKGTAKIAKGLGFDYAEAVTSFEFKNRRAIPVLTGIVVAAENEDVVLEAYWASVAESEEKEKAKRRERVLKRWRKLITGLRIRKRLLDQYASGNDGQALLEIEIDGKDDRTAQVGGGFLRDVDNVIEPFHLPKMLHKVVNSTNTGTAGGEMEEDDDSMDIVPTDDQPALGESSAQEWTPSKVTSAPKTMEELAQSAQTERRRPVASGSKAKAVQSPGPTPPPKTSSARSLRSRAKAPRKRARSSSEEEEEEEDDDSHDSDSPSFARTVRLPAQSGRTLRPRVQKSAEVLLREKEMEAAYRRAIAG